MSNMFIRTSKKQGLKYCNGPMGLVTFFSWPDYNLLNTILF